MLSIVGTDAYFSGFNVHIQSGTGATDGPLNGRGNLIVGDEHEYTSFGGFVAGLANRVTGVYASVSGGEDNTTSGINEWHAGRTAGFPMGSEY